MTDQLINRYDNQSLTDTVREMVVFFFVVGTTTRDRSRWQERTHLPHGWHIELVCHTHASRHDTRRRMCQTYVHVI